MQAFLSGAASYVSFLKPACKLGSSATYILYLIILYIFISLRKGWIGQDLGYPSGFRDVAVDGAERKAPDERGTSVRFNLHIIAAPRRSDHSRRLPSPGLIEKFRAPMIVPASNVAGWRAPAAMSAWAARVWPCRAAQCNGAKPALDLECPLIVGGHLSTLTNLQAWDRWLSHRKGGAGERMWTPPWLASTTLNEGRHVGQVPSYVRPLDAALVGRGPVWFS